MKIHGILISSKQVFIETTIGSDFWITLGEGKGWGRFAMLRPLQESITGRCYFRQVEVLPADAEPPVTVVDCGDFYPLIEQLYQHIDVSLRLPTEGTIRLTSMEDEGAPGFWVCDS